jgi:hypothetical protein
VPFFRRRGVRTQSEIERERFALEVLRGDLDAMRAARERGDVNAILAAVGA